MAYYRPRHNSDNISTISAAPSLAPSYHTVFHDTQLIAPHFRSYSSSGPRDSGGAAAAPRYTRSLSSPSQTREALNVYNIPGFQNFNVPRNEEALHKIAARRHSQAIEDTLKQFSVNYERQEFGRGSAANHPMLVGRARKSSYTLPAVEEAVDDRCPLEQDNEVWDYGFMCSGSYPSLQYYQRRAREITRYEEKEAAIKSAHRRLCVQRSDSDASQSSTGSRASLRD